MSFAVLIEPEHPILIDKFLENAIEVDVDAIADHTGTGGNWWYYETHRTSGAFTQEIPLVLYLPFPCHQQFSIKFGLLDGAVSTITVSRGVDEYPICCCRCK